MGRRSSTLLALTLCLCWSSICVANAQPQKEAFLPVHSSDSFPGDVDLGPLQEEWAHLLQNVWSQVSSHVSFCLGSSQQGILRLMKASFPAPLPVGPEDDAVCGNTTRLAWNLCGRLEIEQYYKVRCVHAAIYLLVRGIWAYAATLAGLSQRQLRFSGFS